MLPSETPPTCSGCGAYGGWPTSGEIDILECVNDMNTVYGSLHYGGPVTTMSSGWSQGVYGQRPLSAVRPSPVHYGACLRSAGCLWGCA